MESFSIINKEKFPFIHRALYLLASISKDVKEDTGMKYLDIYNSDQLLRIETFFNSLDEEDFKIFSTEIPDEFPKFRALLDENQEARLADQFLNDHI